MKKRALPLLLALLTLLGCLLLSGCHGTLVSPEELAASAPAGEDAFQPPETFDENEKISISFWAKNDSNKAQVAIYRKAIRDFQELYPNITVELRLYTDYGKIYNDVITNIPTHTTPNVCVTYPDHIATYRTGEHVVVSLDALAQDPDYGLGGAALKFDGPSREEIVPQFYDECHIDGALYALPFMRSTEACYVNKTFVEALGYELPEVLTWDFVWEVSEKALEKDADGTFKLNGQEKLIPFIYKSTDNMMIQMLKQRGAGYSTAAGDVLIYNQDTKEILLENAKHARSRAFSTFKISSYPGNWLNAGQCIFAVDSTAGATWMGAEAPLLDIPEEQVVPFETAVRAIPQFDPEQPRMISQGPSVCLFYKEDPQEVLAAWLFTQFLLTNDTQIAYAETEGYVPVTLKAQQDPVYQDYLARAGEDDSTHYRVKIEASQLLMANTANTFTTPVFNGSTSVRDTAGLLIESVSKAERRKQTVDDAFLDDLREEACSLYQLTPAAPGWTAGSEAEEGGSAAAEEGPLPPAARALLITLAAAWVCIGLIAGYSALKERRGKKET
ncbi:MAG: extracellular solute-binding protein [Oscillospiraceae bacterium]|nr:extracellular solute-binding protein [Oscillospiraceae bacterium]